MIAIELTEGESDLVYRVLVWVAARAKYVTHNQTPEPIHKLGCEILRDRCATLADKFPPLHYAKEDTNG